MGRIGGGGGGGVPDWSKILVQIITENRNKRASGLVLAKHCGEIISLRCGLKCEVWLGKDHRHFRSRMDASVQNMFEINYSQLIQYEILEKLVT